MSRNAPRHLRPSVAVGHHRPSEPRSRVPSLDGVRCALVSDHEKPLSQPLTIKNLSEQGDPRLAFGASALRRSVLLLDPRSQEPVHLVHLITTEFHSAVDG